jgi:hypothetical protein
MSFKYKLTEVTHEANNFQQKRIDAFTDIETKLDNLKKLIIQAKTDTIKYYHSHPDSYDVVYGTDLANDYLKDLFILFETNNNK